MNRWNLFGDVQACDTHEVDTCIFVTQHDEELGIALFRAMGERASNFPFPGCRSYDNDKRDVASNGRWPATYLCDVHTPSMLTESSTFERRIYEHICTYCIHTDTHTREHISVLVTRARHSCIFVTPNVCTLWTCTLCTYIPLITGGCFVRFMLRLNSIVPSDEFTRNSRVLKISYLICRFFICDHKIQLAEIFTLQK